MTSQPPSANISPSRKSGIRWGWLRLGLPLLFLALLVLWHALVPTTYSFDDPEPFSGSTWNNPYAGSEEGAWYRSNLHAHSEAWGGVTYGRHDPQRVRDTYFKDGYTLPLITNYHSIFEPDDGRQYLPAYEHGYGIPRRHFTVIGAEAPSWMDFPLLQTRHHKQSVIDHLQERSEFLVINHPTLDDAFTTEDLKFLVGYDALEIASKYCRATHLWDAALSSGHRVWGICSDDGHDIERDSHMGIGWLEIAAKDPEPRSLLTSLQQGRFVNVWSRQKERPNRLRAFLYDESTNKITVACARIADTIRFIGQDGKILKSVDASKRAKYGLKKRDHYVRVEVITGSTILYLNPMTRTDGETLATASSPKRFETWLRRTALLLAAAIAIGMFIKRLRLPKPSPRSLGTRVFQSPGSSHSVS